MECLFDNISTSKLGCILQKAQWPSGRHEYFGAGINLIYVFNSYSTAFCAEFYNLSKHAKNS